MPSPLSTDDGDSGNDFDSLEERIVYTERDKEREVRTTVRLAKAHISQLDMIQRELGTNKVEVLTRAYNAGLSELRQIDFVERCNSILDLSNKIGRFANSNMVYYNNGGSDMHRYESYEVEVEEDFEELVEGPVHISIKDSVLSEVKNRLKDVVMIRSGYHRPILTVGLSTSEISTGVIEENAENVIDAFDNAIIESRRRQEREIVTSLPALYPEFSENGIEQKHYEILEESAEMMETEHKETMEELVGFIGTAYDVH